MGRCCVVLQGYFTKVFSHLEKRKSKFSPSLKAQAIVLVLAGMSLRRVAYLLFPSHESVRRWLIKLERYIQELNYVERKPRSLVAIDETYLKVKGKRVFVWSAIDKQTKELLAIKATFRRDEKETWEFIREVRDKCEGKVCFLVDHGPWYKAVFDSIGAFYVQLTFGERNAIERLFRTVKEEARRFCLSFPGTRRDLNVYLRRFQFWYNRFRKHMSLGQPPFPLPHPLL